MMTTLNSTPVEQLAQQIIPARLLPDFDRYPHAAGLILPDRQCSGMAIDAIYHTNRTLLRKYPRLAYALGPVHLNQYLPREWNGRRVCNMSVVELLAFLTAPEHTTEARTARAAADYEARCAKRAAASTQDTQTPQ